MRIKLEIATAEDVLEIVWLRAGAAAKLKAQFGEGPWSRVSTERGVLYEMRNSKVFMARQRGVRAATLGLDTRKPWAIDRKYFSVCKRPLYLLAMAVAPDFQRRGIGRQCLEEAV